MGNDLVQISMGAPPRPEGFQEPFAGAVAPLPSSASPSGDESGDQRTLGDSAAAGEGRAKTFYIETFGCQMNVHDSEKVAGVLISRGYRPVDSHEEAGIILYNTCSIREKAAQKVFSRLGTFKKSGLRTGKVIGVLGCVAQQEGERFFERAPQVSLVCGSTSYTKLPELLDQLEAGQRRVSGLDLDTDECFETEVTRRDNPFRAYLTIIEGCDQRCSFCVVPSTRGPERSRSSRSLLEECRRLVDGGYTEIQLLGQIVNAWRDPAPEGLTFAELLARVAEVPGLRRVRFTTSHPRFFTPDIAQAIETHPVLCDQVHLPAQSGCSAVLERMLRRYTREEYLGKIRCLRSARRAISLSTDIIVGFCGETRKDFEQTLSLLEEVEFDQVFSFKYSLRPRTAAAGLEDPVPDEEKGRRLAELQELQRRIQLRRNQELVGREFEVLVEGYQSRLGQAVGRTTSNRVVNFPGTFADVGCYRQVRITSAGPNSLTAERTENL